ncbi:MAG: response regulator transcription factor [Acidimicrobiales bacterium]
MAWLAIVEDHGRYRQVLRDVLEQAPEVEVVWDCADGAAALDRLAADAVGDPADAAAPVSPPIDVVVVDFSLPGLSGLQVVTEVGRRWPTLRCVVVSGHSRRSYVEQSLAAGAMAYVLKGSPADLRAAVAAALAGHRFVSARLGPVPEG